MWHTKPKIFPICPCTECWTFLSQRENKTQLEMGNTAILNIVTINYSFICVVNYKLVLFCSAIVLKYCTFHYDGNQKQKRVWSGEDLSLPMALPPALMTLVPDPALEGDSVLSLPVPLILFLTSLFSVNFSGEWLITLLFYLLIEYSWKPKKRK